MSYEIPVHVKEGVIREIDVSIERTTHYVNMQDDMLRHTRKVFKDHFRAMQMKRNLDKLSHQEELFIKRSIDNYKRLQITLKENMFQRSI